MTPTEYRLLATLVQQPGQIISNEQLLEQVWDGPVGSGHERIKYSVLRLRRKMGWSDPDTSPLESIRGFGYRYRTNA